MILGRLSQLARNAWLGRSAHTRKGNLSVTLTPSREEIIEQQAQALADQMEIQARAQQIVEGRAQSTESGAL